MTWITGDTVAMATTTLTFLGAAGTVTGSKHLLTIDAEGTPKRRILVDGGLFQGLRNLRRRNWDPFTLAPSLIDTILLTHAHLDHCGYLPRLVRDGFQGRILCTEATKRLAEIVLRDSAYLQERDAEYARKRGYSKHNPPVPLYTVADVEVMLPQMKTVDFDTEIDLGYGTSARFTRAGHILGSASINVSTPGGDVLFSGDIGREEHAVLRSREIPAGASTVLIESTYGDRAHFEPEGESHELFAESVTRTADRGGSVLIPAFAVDRTEVVLKLIGDLQREGRIPTLPIYLNSPMALSALEIYSDPKMAEELRPDVGLEDILLPNLTQIRTIEESEALNRPSEPCIIISASGMATGGRVLHHLKHMLPDPRHTVMLTGYQSVGTRGRALLDGATEIKMHGEYIPVNAEIARDEEFSVHADASELLSWLGALSEKPRIVHCVHGENDSANALAQTIRDELGIMAVVPRHEERVLVAKD